MHIASTQYTLSTESLDIYVSGCNPPHCVGCHNPALWEFVDENNYIEKFYEIEEKVKTFDILIKNLMLFGGEPLDQNKEELTDFLIKLNTLNLDVWLFTRYDLCIMSEQMIALCDYIKTGRYFPELKTSNNIQYGIALATSNQYIYKI